MKWLRDWGPALVWAAVISAASTHLFTSENTSHYILPFLRRLLPNADGDTLMNIHHYIRKGAHVFEYALFTMLIMRALRAGRAEWRWSWVVATMASVTCYAALDEVHQAFVPGRGASAWDSLLDVSSGIAAIVVMWLFARRREKVRQGV